MKKIIIALVFGAMGTGLSSLTGQVEDRNVSSSEADSGYYAFMGAKLLMKHKNDMLPVVSAEEGYFYLDTGSATRKVKRAEQYMINAVVGISDSFLAVDNLEIDYQFAKRKELESAFGQRLDGLDAALVHSIQGTNVSAAEENPVDEDGFDDGFEEVDPQYEDLDPFGETADAIASQGQIKKRYQDGEFKFEEVFDTVSIKMSLSSQMDLEDAFCAVVVSYEKDDAYSRLMKERAAWINVYMLEDIMNKASGEIAVNELIGSGVYFQNTAKIDFYFFDREGMPIASNQSRGLKMLTWSQLERLSKIES